MRPKLKDKILLLYAGVSICILVIIGSLLSSRLKKASFNAIAGGFKSQLVHFSFAQTSFFFQAESNLEVIATNDTVRSRNEQNFMRFLETVVLSARLSAANPPDTIPEESIL